MKELFDDAFLRKLAGLRILARRVPASQRHAEQRSRRGSAGIEFTDLRPYSPGDDFRAVDWHVYQRLDRVFVRLYVEDQDLPIYFVLDQSRSMALPGPGGATKTRVARQAVAALAYIALAHMDRVTVLPFAGEELAPMPALSGKRAFHRLLRYLTDLPVLGDTALVATLRRLRHRRLRRGLCVIVSDLYDPAGADAVLDALRGLPHRLLVVRPVHAGEDEPELRGEVEVVDCETGATVAMTFDDAARERYRDACLAFLARLQDLLSRRASSLCELQTDVDVVEQLAALFPQGVLRA